VWFGSSPPLPPRQYAYPATHRKTENERQLADGWRGEGGWARSRILCSQQSLLLNNSFNTFCHISLHIPLFVGPLKRARLIIGQNYPNFLCHLHFCHPFTRIYMSAGNKFSDSLVYSYVHSQQGHNTCQAGPLGNVFYGLVQGGGLLTLFIAARKDSTVSNKNACTLCTVYVFTY
jgi:hypothetical protein